MASLARYSHQLIQRTVQHHDNITHRLKTGVICLSCHNSIDRSYRNPGPPPITCSLQCLCKLSGQWIQLDMIQDISLCGDDVFSLASRFNTLQLSPLHFRDAVLDSVS